MPAFNAPRRILMGPGPSNIAPRVLAALSEPVIGHLDPEFSQLMERVKDLLRQTFLTENALTMPVSAPGSAGMETCFVNLIEPSDTVLVCINGVFGGRMRENIERIGAKAVVLDQPWGEPVDPERVRKLLQQHSQICALAFVHAETSTGALSDAKTLAGIAREYDAITIVDCVTSLAGVPVRTDDWGLDAVYSGTQKCLSCVPGISPVTFGPRALERLNRRSTKIPSWFLDLNLVMQYWDGGDGARTYHHTAPVNALYALHEALVQLHEEGLEPSWARHRHHHGALRSGLEVLGFEFAVSDPDARLPQLNAVRVPSGIDEAEVRSHLLDEFSLEIGPGLGPWAGEVWRIGLMGTSCTAESVLTFLSAYGDISGAGDSGVRAASEYYETVE